MMKLSNGRLTSSTNSSLRVWSRVSKGVMLITDNLLMPNNIRVTRLAFSSLALVTDLWGLHFLFPNSLLRLSWCHPWLARLNWDLNVFCRAILHLLYLIWVDIGVELLTDRGVLIEASLFASWREFSCIVEASWAVPTINTVLYTAYLLLVVTILHNLVARIVSWETSTLAVSLLLLNQCWLRLVNILHNYLFLFLCWWLGQVALQSGLLVWFDLLWRVVLHSLSSFWSLRLLVRSTRTRFIVFAVCFWLNWWRLDAWVDWNFRFGSEFLGLSWLLDNFFLLFI